MWSSVDGCTRPGESLDAQTKKTAGFRCRFQGLVWPAWGGLPLLVPRCLTPFKVLHKSGRHTLHSECSCPKYIITIVVVVVVLAAVTDLATCG